MAEAIITTTTNNDEAVVAVDCNGTKEIQKQNAEKWEINAIGDFLIQLYHQQVITCRAGWKVLKSELRSEFQKFLELPEKKDLHDKFIASSGTVDIGKLLFRTRYLINTPRGSPLYLINSLKLFQYRNEKLAAYDDKLKNRQVHQMLLQENADLSAMAFDTSDAPHDPALMAMFEVDENAKVHPLTYQGRLIQNYDKDFVLTNMGCYICQLNFKTAEEFEKHVEYHGDASDFDSLKKMKNDKPFFTLSYQLCKKSHYFCFTMKSEFHDIVIDKIIIVQTRSMYYVDNARAQHDMPDSGEDTFFVDSHLFTICQEQPIVIVFHDKDDLSRIAEQHHFVRIEEFPAVQIGYIPCRLSNKILFKKTFKLPQYLPPLEMRTALKDDFSSGKLLQMSNDFANYIQNNNKYTQHNIFETMKTLLQIEDIDTIKEYATLIQHKATLRQYEHEYSLKLKTTKRIFIENLLSQYDEVIIIPEDDIRAQTIQTAPIDVLLMNKDDFAIRSGKDRKKKTYFGQVERISNGRVTFVCYDKLKIDKMYTIIFRPGRITLRYQYRALELLTATSAGDVKRFLFPENVSAPEIQPLTKIVNLELFNENIYDNPEQFQAVRHIANGPHKDAPYVIFGPPGTGKTTTVVEAILQLYTRRPDTKILVTSGSNSACDEIALRLCEILSKREELRSIVRIYARANERRSDNIDELLLEYSNMYAGQFYPAVEVLHQFRIVVCTLTVVGKLATGKFGKDATGKGLFTHIFIDEVAASTEAEVLVGIMGMTSMKSSLIISGDHKQLGPIIQSNRAKELGLDISLMDRLMERDCYRLDDNGDYNRSIQSRLRRNFRSHHEIVNLYNCLYYNNELLAKADGDDINLCAKWHLAPNPNYPIIFHSVFGTSENERNSVSLSNSKELEIVMDYVKDLIYFGVNGEEIKQEDIGIISPYKRQYLRIQEELNLRHWYKIETGSVETFQGREKRIIIVSFVRSFTKNLGFLDNCRRLNVILSRPKSLLILIGNPKTLSLNADYKHIIDECQRNKTLIGSRYFELADGIYKRNKSAAKLKNLTKSMETLNLNKNPNQSGNKQTKTQNQNQNKENRITENGVNAANRKRIRKRNAKNKNNANQNIDTENKANVAVAGGQHNLAQSIKKRAKTTSQQNQRKTFEVYKNLIEKNAKEDSTGNYLMKNMSIDQLFDNLPNVPIQQHAAEGAKYAEMLSMKDMKIDFHERMSKLEMKASNLGATLASASHNFNTDLTMRSTSPFNSTKLTTPGTPTKQNVPKSKSKNSTAPQMNATSSSGINSTAFGATSTPGAMKSPTKQNVSKDLTAPQMRILSSIGSMQTNGINSTAFGTTSTPGTMKPPTLSNDPKSYASKNLTAPQMNVSSLSGINSTAFGVTSTPGTMKSPTLSSAPKSCAANNLTASQMRTLSSIGSVQTSRMNSTAFGASSTPGVVQRSTLTSVPTDNNLSTSTRFATQSTANNAGMRAGINTSSPIISNNRSNYSPLTTTTSNPSRLENITIHERFYVSPQRPQRSLRFPEENPVKKEKQSKCVIS